MKKIQKYLFLFIAALTITLSFPNQVSAAPLGDDRTIFGESYTLESGRILDGDLNVIGGIVEIEKGAQVNGDLTVVGGLVTIDGIIAGNLTAIGGTVNLNENAVIQGDLISPASYIHRSPAAIIEGDQIENWTLPWTYFNMPEFYRRGNFRTPRIPILTIVTRIGRGIAFTLILTALGALLLLMMPKSAEVMTRALETQPWVILGYGALTAFVVLVGSIIFAITICLIPVVILVDMAFSLAVLVGWLILGFALGKKISESLFKSAWHPVLSAALGNLLLYVIAVGVDLIPCLGGFLIFIAMLFSLGTTVVTLFGTHPYPRVTFKEDKEKIILFEDKQAKSKGERQAEEIAPSIERMSAQRPIEDLGLEENNINILKNAGMVTIDDVLEHLASGDDEFKALDGFGEKSILDLIAALRRLGYDIPGYSE